MTCGSTGTWVSASYFVQALLPAMALYREHATHIAELLGHVLVNALHLTAKGRGGGPGLVADLAPRQVCLQWRTLEYLPRLFSLCWRLRLLQRSDVRGHRSKVGLELVFVQALMFRVEILGMGSAFSCVGLSSSAPSWHSCVMTQVVSSRNSSALRLCRD